MKRLLSGNEAIALGAYHAGVRVATAYPGTPSTEILETLAGFDDVYAEWSTNEKVALEVAQGAAIAGVRAMSSMKQVGLNVALDPFMAAALTGAQAGLVVVSADDPGVHSSQGEQDNRYLARFAKVPMLEPADSQEAYELMSNAFDISEKFDTPVLFRTTTRLSHSKSVVEVDQQRSVAAELLHVQRDMKKYIMLPVNARTRGQSVEERWEKLRKYVEDFPHNKTIWGDRRLGIVTSGVAYQYAREVFSEASFLKLGMTSPLPLNLIRAFAEKVDKLFVIEELGPYLEESIRMMGIPCTGKEFIPVLGELNPNLVEEAGQRAGLLPKNTGAEIKPVVPDLPKRPPLLCPGCPHTGLFYTLSMLGHRSKGNASDDLIITGDIGCYTLGAYPPLNAMDTTACMGASIGQALGMAKAGVSGKVVAVIGDSTFLHSGITGLVNAVYNSGQITLVILDNSITAMTGHQDHPGSGTTAQGKPAKAVVLEDLTRGAGVSNVKVVDAFDMKTIRETVKNALDGTEFSVIIVRGGCAVLTGRREPQVIDVEICNDCGLCLRLGCPAIQRTGAGMRIETTLCNGCTVCQQICPSKAILPQSGMKVVHE